MMTDGSEGISDELVITFSPGITYENHVIIGELIMCSQSAVKEERGLKIQIAFFDEPVESTNNKVGSKKPDIQSSKRRTDRR